MMILEVFGNGLAAKIEVEVLSANLTKIVLSPNPLGVMMTMMGVENFSSTNGLT